MAKSLLKIKNVSFRSSGAWVEGAGERCREWGGVRWDGRGREAWERKEKFRDWKGR